MKIRIVQPCAIHEMGKRTNQEDSLWPPLGKATDKDCVFLVCDGMGGHEHGEVASQTVAETIGRYAESHPVYKGMDVNEWLRNAINEAYNQLDAWDDEMEERKMGTTLTLLCFHRRGCTMAHIGDSRIYHIRPTEHRILYQSRDHSLVMDLYLSGELEQEEIKDYKGKNIITRCMQPLQERRSRADVVHTTDLQAGDYFFLCSDGITESLTEKDLLKLLAQDCTDEEKCRKLVKSTANNADNHTAYLIRIAGVEPEPEDADAPNDEHVSRTNMVVIDKRMEEEKTEGSWWKRFLRAIGLCCLLLLPLQALNAQTAGGMITGPGKQENSGKQGKQGKQEGQGNKGKTGTNNSHRKPKPGNPSKSTEKPRQSSRMPKKEEGMLTITSTPEGAKAEVWQELADQNGTFVINYHSDTTPFMLTGYEPGEYKITYSLEGYESQTHVVTINANTTAECNVELKRIPLAGQMSASSVASTSSASSLTVTANGVPFRMIRVEGGVFTMGATAEQANYAESDENPMHKVTLSSYYIGETEVTQALWRAVMGSNPAYFEGDNHPVELVSWDDCQTFIRRLNALTGQTFRLPTEAEWEFAARGGNHSQGYRYSGSNFLSLVAHYGENSGDETRPVKTKSPNELGIYDMSGNVTEWCWDLYGKYTSFPQANPAGADSGSARVYRGGNAGSVAGDCRVSYRDRFPPDTKFNNLGLRLVM